jgi:DNA-binding IclR family transcriptional regulator
MVNNKVETFYNRSLERALSILNTFNNDRQTLTAAELARMVGLPRATVMRLCHTLVKYRFLRQEKESKRYSLGIKLFELGSIVFNSMSLRRIASPYLKELQKDLVSPSFSVS